MIFPGHLNYFLSIHFADDTSVFLIRKEYTQLIISLNEELKKVSHWLNANGLTINLKKTHYMVFHRARIRLKISMLKCKVIMSIV